MVGEGETGGERWGMVGERVRKRKRERERESCNPNQLGWAVHAGMIHTPGRD